MKPKMTSLTIIVLSTISIFAGPEKAIMRYPDIYKNTIVFSHAGDLWKTSSEGGKAIRLTTHDGEETFPRFSPGGKLIAFSAQYDGNTDVYVMNTDGGSIRRVTFHPEGDTVIGWHPISKKIMFSSTRTSHDRFSKLFVIAVDGTGLEELPIHEIALGSFSPDGKQIAYNKVSRESRTWKRYKGGTAQDLYLYDFKTKENKKLTQFKGTDRIPMWIGEKIYFTSDRDRVLNIYSMDSVSGSIEQLTFHSDYDVRRPSFGTSKIIYEHGGTLCTLDLASGDYRKVPIEIASDSEETRPYLKNVQEYMTQIDVSPNGKRALISARGELFSVPKEYGSIKNLTNTPGARDIFGAWSPDGMKIAWISDQNGEYEIYIRNLSDGKTDRLTKHKSGFRHSLRWSPDSKKLAYTDQTLTLYVLDIVTRKEIAIDRAEYEHVDISIHKKPISDFSWSPDSRYITFAKMSQDLVYNIFIHSFVTGKTHNVSEGLFNDFNPVFSADGTHLLFVSNRRFDPTFCDFEWELVYKKMAGVYAMTLQEDGAPLLPLREDVPTPNAKEKSSGTAVDIDFSGLLNRIEALPIGPGNYRDLAVTSSAVYFLNRDEGDFNRFEFRVPEDMDLYMFSWKKRSSSLVIKGIQTYKISGDGKTIIYRDGENVGLIPAGTTDSRGVLLDLTKLQMWIDPIKEWTQIFNEAWRLERDYYYEPNMHGANWDSMQEKYGSMVEIASCRQDLGYLIGEMIGELNTSHTYVYGGDRQRRSSQVNVGMLGVDWYTDAKSKYYQFAKIFKVTDWSNEMFPPLAGPGKKVEAGDFLLALNGQPVTTEKNIYSYFQNTANRQVTLTISRTGKPGDSWDITVVPDSSEQNMRYLDWVEHNRYIVDQASKGQIGYIHFPDTFLDSAIEFPKSFFSLARKKGIIVDGRFNSGGLDPHIFLKRLNRKPHAYWTRRYSHDQATPVYAPGAHMACLTNRQAGSGGDELPEEFRYFNMGPVIGTRSWGGLVGVSMFIPLIDNGGLTAPDYRIYSDKGKWIVENEGITPDIEVDLDPAEVEKGIDAQLQTAIQYLLIKIEQEPRPWPEHEAYPIDK